MKAAVVQSFAQGPSYQDFAEPTPQDGEVLLTVRASALSQLVRAQAAGKHYSSGTPPLVPGADGVGLLPDGQRVYFAFPRAPFGAMAERAVVKRSYCVPVPDDVDDVTAAAIANPGMSSWAALSKRARFENGEGVLVHGATGASGRLAIQIAKHLGASRVVATGRNGSSEKALRALGADAFIPLDLAPDALLARFKAELAQVDVVLDYLWGPAAEVILSAAAAGHRPGEAARSLRYVQIGSLAGLSISLPAMALRSSGVSLMGSGLGSVSNQGLVDSIGELMQAVVSGGLSVDAETVPLRDVAAAWQRDAGTRLVFTLT